MISLTKTNMVLLETDLVPQQQDLRSSLEFFSLLNLKNLKKNKQAVFLYSLPKPKNIVFFFNKLLLQKFSKQILEKKFFLEKKVKPPPP